MNQRWKKRKLGDICGISSALVDPREPEYIDLPHIGAGNMISGTGELIDIKTAKEEGLKSGKYTFDRSMVLYSKIRPYLMKAARPDFYGLCSADVYPLSPDTSQLDRDFLFHLLLSKEFTDYAIAGSSRAGMPKVNRSHLFNFTTYIPPIAEQKRIVAILDEAFEGIDGAIANTEKNLTNARELFESYLQAIFTRKGDDWIDKKLLSVCERITVGHVGSMKSKYQESGIPFLRSQNILPFEVSLEKVAFIDKEFHDSLKKSKLKPGDVAIVRTGYPGTAAVIPETLPDSNCSDLVIVTPSAEVNPHYLCLFFNSTFGKRLVSGNLVGAAQKHFNVTAAKNVNLPCPPIALQEKLVAMCDEFSAETQRLEAIYQQKLAALNELKQSILQKAFSGELTTEVGDAAVAGAEAIVAA